MSEITIKEVQGGFIVTDHSNDRQQVVASYRRVTQIVSAYFKPYEPPEMGGQIEQPNQ